MSKFKGELTLKNGMIMVLDNNALAHYEDITGKNSQDLFAKIDKQKQSMADIRYLYLAMLKRHQPAMTIDEAGDVMADYPTAWAEAVTLAFPQAEEVGNDQPKGKPKKA